MDKNQLKALKNLLASPKKVVIIPHKNPDGDAIGSTLGLSMYLEKLGHSCTVIAPNDYPQFLKWIPQQERILKFDHAAEQSTELIKVADIICTLDFNHLSRIGAMEKVVADVDATFVMIDHHQQPADYADFMYSDTTMSSTCEMVYHFMDMLGDVDLVDKDIATCLYTGIMTDTGSFKFASTTGTTHRVAAALLDTGIDGFKIHSNILDTNSTNRMKLLGCALNNLVVLEEYKTAFISLSREELNDNHFKKGDTEGFVNYGLSLEGIVFAVIFIQDLQEDFIKLSLRSKGSFSVNQFAREHFKGGGHDNAAGGRSDDTMEATIERFKSVLPNYKNELQEAYEN
ncbi:DHH family phosphoesterase [Spongiivirga citrea]|uniref:Bifunctional oligoribonuclease/PAP phosphatase NrnA n=1 Tax=Spongiivirga citrea TaxID=1481457 RepID=A0A6M0CXY2_9FLAO|nr:bifunctional oligoribonuclease/PAP phosphatase NrnA [Spongiivirga citrea]NER18550.1 bifunctional oligoribonuclease/PAP phosphatase NrnA [Spongiivirga citrea]